MQPEAHLHLGTAIYYYGNYSPFGSMIQLTLDGVTATIDSRKPDLPEQRATLLWSKTGLDGSALHTFTVTGLGPNYVDVDRVDITLPAQNSASPPPSSPSPSPSPKPSNPTSNPTPPGINTAPPDTTTPLTPGASPSQQASSTSSKSNT